MCFYKQQCENRKNIMENSNVTPLVPKDKKNEDNSLVSSLSPREIVSELDRFVVGQTRLKELSP